MSNFICLTAAHLYWSLIIAQYCNTLCVADLYQVNRARTLCYSDVAEFFCSQTDTTLLYWTVTSTSGMVRFLSFLAMHDSNGLVRNTTIDSTTLTAKLLHSDNSSIESLIAISTDLSATIQCNSESIQHQVLNSKYYYNYYNY